MAEALIGQGANVMITGARATAELEETAATFSAMGAAAASAWRRTCPIRRRANGSARATQEAFGSIDVLVNNAARGPTGVRWTRAGRQAHLQHIREGLKTGAGP